MTKKLVKKHDELAKKFLTDITVAQEFLEAHLPTDVLRQCNLSTLKIESGSYIDNDLRKRFSDVVYKVSLIDGISCAYIYTLIEHQSSDDKLMPIRIIKYQLEIINNHIEKHGSKDSGLPIVVPLMFYNGEKSPYPHPYDIADLFADKELFQQIGLGKFKLIDLTIANNDDILKHKQVALLENVLKHIRDRDFNLAIQPIVQALLVAHHDGLSKDLFDSMLSYLTCARKVEELQPLLENNY